MYQLTIVGLGRLHLSGFVAWTFWRLVHVAFLIGSRSKGVATFEWLRSSVTRQRSARLISDGLANVATSAARKPTVAT
jgi:NADH dehydrogenase